MCHNTAAAPAPGLRGGYRCIHTLEVCTTSSVTPCVSDRHEMEGEQSTWMVKEFGVMHEEVSSSFMKQAQQYNALHHKVSSTKEGFERLCRENGERELQIRERETELAYEDDVVKRLRTEHASLEEKNKRMRDQEEQLEATRKEEHCKYIETLDKCTRQMYASRQASRDACKAPELARQPGEDSRPRLRPPRLCSHAGGALQCS